MLLLVKSLIFHFPIAFSHSGALEKVRKPYNEGMKRSSLHEVDLPPRYFKDSHEVLINRYSVLHCTKNFGKKRPRYKRCKS
jgi:hypothetical protein